MGIFDGISQADKKRLLAMEISSLQIQLFTVLIQISIDPDTFDETLWAEPLNMETPTGRVRHYIDLITSMKVKLAELG